MDTNTYFTSQEKQAWGALLSLYARMNRVIEADLQTKHGLSHVEFEILLRLEKAPAHQLRLQDIAEKSVLTRSGTSRAVERLERADLLTRSSAPEDRRGAYATLTEFGLRTYHTALQEHVTLVRHHFFSAFTQGQVGELAHLWVIWEAHQASLTNNSRRE